MNVSLYQDSSTIIILAASYWFPPPLSRGMVMAYYLVEGLVDGNR